jgi:hypothetical protein
VLALLPWPVNFLREHLAWNVVSTSKDGKCLGHERTADFMTLPADGLPGPAVLPAEMSGNICPGRTGSPAIATICAGQAILVTRHAPHLPAERITNQTRANAVQVIKAQEGG